MPPGPPMWMPLPAPRGPAAGLEWGGFGRRLGAWLMDGIVVIVAALVLTIPTGAFAETSAATGGFTYTFTGTDGIAHHYVLQSWGYLVVGLFAFVYDGGLWLAGGATLGQRAVGLRVLRVADGGRLGVREAAIRGLIFALPTLLGTVTPALGSLGSLALLLCGLSMVWDARMRGWHDRLAGTVVVHRIDAGARPQAMVAPPGYGPPVGWAPPPPGYAPPPPGYGPPPGYAPPPPGYPPPPPGYGPPPGYAPPPPGYGPPPGYAPPPPGYPPPPPGYGPPPGWPSPPPPQ